MHFIFRLPHTGFTNFRFTPSGAIFFIYKSATFILAEPYPDLIIPKDPIFHRCPLLNLACCGSRMYGIQSGPQYLSQLLVSKNNGKSWQPLPEQDEMGIPLLLEDDPKRNCVIFATQRGIFEMHANGKLRKVASLPFVFGRKSKQNLCLTFFPISSVLQVTLEKSGTFFMLPDKKKILAHQQLLVNYLARQGLDERMVRKDICPFLFPAI
jgi:hypothetical protein